MRKMMVCHDEINTVLGGCFGSREGTNAGIDADYETHAPGGGLGDHFVPHAVAFANAVRHVVLDFATAQLQRGLQDHNSGGTVDIVVAVDEDRLGALDGSAHPFDGCAQSAHEVGRMKLRELW